MRNLRLLTILAILTLGTTGIAHAQFTGGNGGGWGTAVSSSSVVLNTISTDTNVKLIRAGQAVTFVERLSGGVSLVTLSAAYPNNNLKALQKIVVDVDDNTFDGTFVITWVAADFCSFKYVQTPSPGIVASKAATGDAGGHYTTLTAWEAVGGYTTAECYNDWNGGLVENLTIVGNSADSTHYMKIAVPVNERNTGSAGTGFRINPASGNAITVGDNYASIENIEAVGPVVLSSPAALTVEGNILFTGGITVSSGAAINASSSNMVIASSGGLSLPSGGTFNAQGSSVTFSGCDTSFDSGTFNPGQGILIFSGALTWTPKVDVEYHIVKFTSGIAVISGTAVITDQLISDTGSSGALNGGAITLTGDLSCLSGTGGTTEITMNDTLEPQSIFGASTGSGGTTPPLTINKSGQEAHLYRITGMESLSLTAGSLNIYRDDTEAGNAITVVGAFSVSSGCTVNAYGNTAVVNSDNGGTAGNPYGAGVTISAAALTISSGAHISADGKGFRASQGPGAGGWASDLGAGAGYAGAGGDCSTASGGSSYGSSTAPTALGSGGGGAGGVSGGGAIKLVVTGASNVSGTLSANGIAGSYGGGSGGSIWLVTGTLEGSGAITANGANGASASHGGGSGGRIRLEYSSETYSGVITAAGGTGYESGADGTESQKDSSIFLIFDTQPAATATAGVGFTTQPVVKLCDAEGTRTGDSASLVTLSRGATGTDTLQGETLTLRLTNGVAAFSGLYYNKAEVMNISADVSAYGIYNTSAADFTAGTLSNTAISGTGDAGSVVLGFPSHQADAITITDNGGGIRAVNDIRIRIPATFNMTWDAARTTPTLTGSAARKVSPAVSYESGNKVVVLNVTSNFADGDTLIVSGLYFTNISAVSSSDNLELDIFNTGTGYVLDAKNLSIEAAS